MDDNKLTEFIISINARLASIDAKLDTVHAQLKDHSQRILRLESGGARKPDFKEDIIKLLTKAVLVSLCGFATLAGAGSVIAKMVG